MAVRRTQAGDLRTLAQLSLKMVEEANKTIEMLSQQAAELRRENAALKAETNSSFTVPNAEPREDDAALGHPPEAAAARPSEVAVLRAQAAEQEGQSSV